VVRAVLVEEARVSHPAIEGWGREKKRASTAA